MRTFIATSVFILVLVGVANSTESGILTSNLVGWEGVSLWCDNDAIPKSKGMDQSGYICGIFYGEFSKAAKQHNISFAYVQTDGKFIAEKLLAMGYLPIQINLEAISDQIIQVEIVSDIAIERPLVKTIRIYENPVLLKGNPFTYGKRLISFFKKSADSIARDLSFNGGKINP